MITLLKSGVYKLSQTKKTHTKLLSLDEKNFAWITFDAVGEILVRTVATHALECRLAMGNYRIYAVKEESGINDNTHLELQLSDDVWQGYLLLTGLPNQQKKRARVIPTSEIITGSNFKINRRVVQAAQTISIK